MTAVRQPTTSARHAPFPRAPARGLQPAPGLPRRALNVAVALWGLVLPQLVNVLRGDMNVVGPRPEQPAIFARLRAEIAAYPQRQRVRPGITGWAQVNQSYDSCVEDVRRKLAFDLEYIRRESVGEDLRIMLRTVPVMVLRLGAW